MDTFQAPSANSAPSQTRHLSSNWNNHFRADERRPHVVESQPLSVAPGDCKIDAFIRAEEGVLSPPSFNWNPLDLFLHCAGLKDLTDRRRNPRLSRLCLIDDRSFRSGERQHSSTSPADSTCVTEGDLCPNVTASYRKALNERELYDRLLEDVSQRTAS